MADTDATLRQWSVTPGNNKPSGSTPVGTSLDDNLRVIQQVVRQYLAASATPMSSGATVDLATADGFFIEVQGTTTITSLGTEAAGIHYVLKFADALTLTHNSTSLILPGGANITTAAGDVAWMVSEGSGNWRCAFYSPADGQPFGPFVDSDPIVKGSADATKLLRFEVDGFTTGTTRTFTARDADFDIGAATQAEANAMASNVVSLTPNTNLLILGTPQATTSGTAINFTSIPSGVRRVTVMLVGVSTNGTDKYIVQIGPVGGIETSGYSSVAQAGVGSTTSSQGFILQTDSPTAAGNTVGRLVLDLVDPSTNTWIGTSTVYLVSTSDSVEVASGRKAISGILERIRLTTTGGTDAFDDGIVNISYER